MNRAINTEVGRRTVHDSCLACIDLQVKRSRSRGYQIHCQH